ncbi:hypothetical protein EP18_14790 [Lysinibacillus sphaericus]|nr:hypothetical protein [Lysinibacillus sphaericus]KEK10911.1 hypothetical protein EP18_14790 [Lysinibacillus sphaericus]
MKNIKVTLEVKAFGEEKFEDIDNAYKGIEISRTKVLSKDMTLGELETHLKNMFKEVELIYNNPEQLVGKITILAKKEFDEIKYIG